MSGAPPATGRWLTEAPYDAERRRIRQQTGRPPFICRWCGGPVERPRHSWCSDACVEEFTVRRGSGWVRRLVARRDGGVCQACGLDCRRLARRLDRLSWDQKRRGWERLRERGFIHGQSLWEADHIVPVCEGGGACGLDNYRTLCRPCHLAETAALARRRAEQRSGQAVLPLGGETGATA